MISVIDKNLQKIMNNYTKRQMVKFIDFQFIFVIIIKFLMKPK